ncbi:MAG: hypothetical protein ACUVTW_09155, partial [Thermogutta sp.]
GGWSKNREKMVPAGRRGRDLAGIFTPAAGNAILAPTPNPKNQGTSEHRNRLWFPVLGYP